MMLNDRALRLVDRLVAEAETLRITVAPTPNGARVLDCGVQAEGGMAAGLALARVCLADLADVTLLPPGISDLPCPLIQVVTDHPILACMASQYAGWQVSVGKFFAMGSGPMAPPTARKKSSTTFPVVNGRPPPSACWRRASCRRRK